MRSATGGSATVLQEGLSQNKLTRVESTASDELVTLADMKAVLQLSQFQSLVTFFFSVRTFSRVLKV